MITKLLTLIGLMVATLSTALAANPVDLIAAPIQEHVNISQQEIQKKAMEHITQGNLTKEHIGQDINATKNELKEQAIEHLNENLNITPDQLQQKAKEELQRQATQKVQQPGFEAILALAGILGITFFLRRRN
jgi:PGF-CTERM protein